MKKKTLFLGMLMVMALAVLAGCTAPAPDAQAPAVSPTTEATATPEVAASPEATDVTSPDPGAAAGEEKTFTTEELATFNGLNGQPAYIAVNGIVYDVTANPAWNEGMHQGYAAGKDVTEEIKAASHGEKVLEGLPIVGKLVDATMADVGLLITAEELVAYDGKEGRPAYIAVNGTIYDVSDSNFWKDGAHNGFVAGNEWTEEIKSQSPHGEKVLENLPVVGQIKN